MKLLSAAGYGIEEVVCCASERGALLLGLQRAGRRLAPGRPASFLVCPGPPARLPDSLYRLKAFYVEGQPVLRASKASAAARLC